MPNRARQATLQPPAVTGLLGKRVWRAPKHVIGSLMCVPASASNALISCWCSSKQPPSSPDPKAGKYKPRCAPMGAAGARRACVWDLERVSTGCWCRPRARRWQLPLLPGAGSSKARKRAPGSAAPDLRCCALQRLPCCLSTSQLQGAHTGNSERLLRGSLLNMVGTRSGGFAACGACWRYQAPAHLPQHLF